MIRGDASRTGTRISRRVLPVLAVAGLLGLATMASAAVATSTQRAHRVRATTKTRLASYSGSWGRQLVVEMKGQKLSLFSFSADSLRKSACYGRCQKVWYPLLKHGRLVVVKGSHINIKQLKTIRRKNGSLQVEYYGQPLYRCHKDTKTGQLMGANSYQFGGSWGLMGAQGSPLTRPGYGGGKQIPGC